MPALAFTSAGLDPLEDELWLPPAAQGDVLRAVIRHHPDQIVLIDGTFYQTLSVWHKEIVFALLEGVTVIGAASIGAIRAAEMWRYGMIGVGEIFARYRDGETEDDSEVVLTYEPDTFRPLTVPHVGLEAKTRDALAAIDFARSFTGRSVTSLDKESITPYLQVIIDRILGGIDMPDDSDFGPVYQSGDEALAAPPAPVTKDPGETAPPIPEAAEGVGEGDIDAITMNEHIAAQQKARDTVTRLQNQTQPMWEKYKAMLQKDEQQRQQMTADEQAQLQQVQPPPEKKNDWIQAIGGLMAVAVPIALAFGMKGNGYAKGAMMQGLGDAMKNFAAGRKQAGEQAMRDYREQVASINQSNRERHQIYKDILANRKLELEDQFKMIHATAQEFWDPHMSKAAKNRDMAGVTKQLENQDKIAKKFAKGAKDAGHKVARPSHWNDYVRYMHDKYHIDPDKEPDKADEKLTYTDWDEGHRTASERKASEKMESKAAEEVNAPLSDDEAAKMRAALLGDE